MYGFKVSERERERAAAAVTATGETLTHAKAAKTDQICPQINRFLPPPPLPLENKTKVMKCPNPRAHDWTECPYAHPGAF